MDNFTFTQDNCKEETTSTWLIAVIQFGFKLNILRRFSFLSLR